MPNGAAPKIELASSAGLPPKILAPPFEGFSEKMLVEGFSEEMLVGPPLDGLSPKIDPLVDFSPKMLNPPLDSMSPKTEPLVDFSAKMLVPPFDGWSLLEDALPKMLIPPIEGLSPLMESLDIFLAKMLALPPEELAEILPKMPLPPLLPSLSGLPKIDPAPSKIDPEPASCPVSRCRGLSAGPSRGVPSKSFLPISFVNVMPGAGSGVDLKMSNNFALLPAVAGNGGSEPLSLVGSAEASKPSADNGSQESGVISGKRLPRSRRKPGFSVSAGSACISASSRRRRTLPSKSSIRERTPLKYPSSTASKGPRISSLRA